MSVQNAFLFVRQVRENEDLARRLESLGRSVRLEQLVALGADAGFDFTAEELCRAHEQDWALRSVRYSARRGAE